LAEISIYKRCFQTQLTQTHKVPRLSRVVSVLHQNNDNRDHYLQSISSNSIDY